MWLYLWGMSERQVELLLADQPVTIYLDNDKKHKKGAVGKDDMPTPSAAKVLEAQRKWMERNAGGGGKVTLGDILGGAAK